MSKDSTTWDQQSFMKQLDAKQHTIVRVWFSREDGGADVGHVSLQTPNRYMSLWPGVNTSKRSKPLMLFEHRPFVQFNDYDTDVASEKRPPEFICYLYSLNTAAMEKRFDEIKAETKSWSAAGNTKIFNNTHQISRSCSSLGREILIVGGIGDLSTEGATVHIMPSPHNVFTRARNAKKMELERYPITRAFDQQNGIRFDSRNDVRTLSVVQVAENGCSIS